MPSLNRQPSIRLQSEIQELSSGANPSQGPDAAPPSQKVGRPRLGELLKQELRQEKIEQAEKAEQDRQQRRAALEQLVHSALPDGGQAMKRLKERAVRKHPKTAAQIWHSIQTGLPKTMKDQRRSAFETLVRADLRALASTGQIAPRAAVDQLTEALGEGIFGQGILKRDRALLLEILGDLSLEGLYRRWNLAMTDDTKPAFTDADLLQVPKPFGAGKSTHVYEVKLKETDGAVLNALFKPIPKEDWSYAGLVTGIPRYDPQTVMRNLATVDYARKLGFHVIPDTRVALIDVDKKPFDPSLGLLMELAPGEPAERTPASVLARADVRAEVTKLQLLDHLTGEGDRHGFNYFIHIDADDRPTVMGIDNDQCFGEKLTDPDGARYADDSQHRLLEGVGLPPVVDTDMERAIEAMTEDDIHSMLGNKLNTAEIAAALQRYRGLKAHIVQLREQNLVIDPKDWETPQVQALMTPQNSYLARDLQRVAGV
ncbi:hypothetical protein AVMA1855_21550 [Acidovorax sp. SUPP1855]|uniref:hypothetical protein n=1 Tax=Acidovorax sp. SUPP1855 TaxID=431774 RepID=UPI0023DE1FBE|nr:hypothetical protein [Acidovorax sp. SUPP1855]GKS86784.1 hypothetical protein AVMA1855_21550 [Acidovorax sp. SUPP1855]